MKLTNNFNKSEFECRDGSEMPIDVLNNVKELAQELQKIRDLYGKPIRINSAYRSLEYNRTIGSKDTSQHVKGTAADIVINGVDPSELAYWIKFWIAEGLLKEGGVGLYNTFVHYDIFYDGVNRRRWDNT